MKPIVSATYIKANTFSEATILKGMRCSLVTFVNILGLKLYEEGEILSILIDGDDIIAEIMTHNPQVPYATRNG